MNIIFTLHNEIRKELLTTLSYKFQWLGEFATLIIFYFFLNKLSNNPNLSSSAYLVWFYSILIIGDTSGKISSEMRLGTFEQMSLSTLSLPSLFILKTVASIIRCSVLMSFLFVLFFITGQASFETIFNPFLWISVFCITPGLFGISLALAGITILIKDSGWIVNILNNSMLFLSGIFLSTENLSPWAKQISRISPTAQAVTVLHHEATIFTTLVFTLACSLIYLALGLNCFFFCDKLARKRGVLGYH